MAAETLIALALTIPLAGALGIWLAGGMPNLREGVTLVTAAALFAVVVPGLMPMIVAGARPELLLAEVFAGIEIAIQVEPLGMLFACIASSLWIVNSVYSIGYMRGNDEPRQTPFFICFAIAIWSAVGIAFAANLFTLFLFYEMLTLSTYPLVTHHADEDSRQKGRVYLVLLISTSMILLLPAIITTFALTGTTDFVPGGILGVAGLSAGALTVLYTAYAYGIGKAALMPVHFWLPAAMVAPTPVSALLHAVAVVKAGVFCVVKVTVYIFGLDLLQATGASQVVAWIAGATVLLASLVALMQDNFKRRLAFSTVSQLSYIVMAAAVATPVAIVGAAFHILAHAVSKITLFFAAGSIYTAAHLTDVSQLDGIGRKMPLTLFAYMIGALSIIGLPPLVGVWSKWWIGVGAVESGDLWVVVVLMLSSLLNVAYLLPPVTRGWFAPIRDGDHSGAHDGAHDGAHHGDGSLKMHEAPWTCVLAIGVTALLCVVFFFAANPVEQLLIQIPVVPPDLTPAVEAPAPSDLVPGAEQPAPAAEGPSDE